MFRSLSTSARSLDPRVCSVAFWWLVGPAWAQAPLSLGEAVRIAAEATPSAAADAAALDLASARVAQARASLFPELAISGGATVGTGNVVAGGLFAPTGYPAVSGPPAPVALKPGWQAQGGATVGWDLLALVSRVREVDAALAAEDRDASAAAARRQERSVAGAFAWISVAESDAALEVARGDLERARRVLEVAEALSSAGVRPDVERALAASEVALAEQRLARAEGNVRVARARLATALGGDDELRSRPLAAPPERPPNGGDASPPVVDAARADLASAGAGVAAARASFAPRLELVGATWYRAGAWPPGGPVATAPNWAGGVVVEVPLLDGAARKAEVRAARASEDAAAARLESVRITVDGQQAEALALLEAASRADAVGETVVGAAVAARGQAEARFEAGLVDVTVVATAIAREREARLEQLSARFDVLRAALTRDYVHGDLSAWTEAPR